MITIAIDAMGGDHAPQVPIQAVNQAIDKYPQVQFKVYGDQTKITPLIRTDQRIEVIHCDGIIDNEDDPVRAVRTKKESSMVKAARAVKDGEADVLLSAGSTGALLTAGLLIVGRIPGIDRPGLMPVIPTISSEHPHLILMDAGANADTKPINIQQFAVMANVYARRVLNIERPRVGLINNGTEASKGSQLSKEAYTLLSELDSIHFVGNIEAKNLLSGEIDIAVTDGFTGNAILKTLEGTVKSLVSLLKSTFKSGNLSTKIGAFLIKNPLKNTLENLDDSKQGGAVLLGVKAPVIKAHGSADEEAYINAIRQSIHVIESQAVVQITNYFSD
ncbi:phosphate acyltransferase PlsX [Falseniella ignava]|uniref:Phosphate acyltransferase n=1 Tax=Falseniella ignava TaxID=137730 RepID=A0A2I1K434_9LACT|nr:phosphate acyltransferase PlsX [Falseniella ignava]PKY90406.1 phosphate acyltransferase PlsX [Falseniella ignava]